MRYAAAAKERMRAGKEVNPAANLPLSQGKSREHAAKAANVAERDWCGDRKRQDKPGALQQLLKGPLLPK